MRGKVNDRKIYNKRYFKDNFGNSATIEEREILPYIGSTLLEKAYVLSLYADYDNNFMYFRAVYETEEDAMKNLSLYSCGTFKEKRFILYSD